MLAQIESPTFVFVILRTIKLTLWYHSFKDTKSLRPNLQVQEESMAFESEDGHQLPLHLLSR